MAKLNEPPFRDEPAPENRFWSLSWFEWLRDIHLRVNERTALTGGGTEGNFPKFDSGGDFVDSGKAAPSGDVVGTTDTQTLTNKTADYFNLTNDPTANNHAVRKSYLDSRIDGYFLTENLLPEAGTEPGFHFGSYFIGDGTNGIFFGDDGTITIYGTAGNIYNVNSITFNTDPTHTHSEGAIHWADDDKTLNVDTEIDGVTIHVGQEIVIRATNKTGSTLSKGKAVYISGAQGNRPTIALADPNNHTDMHQSVGLVAANIDNNGTGYVIQEGLIRNLDTSAWTAGTVLYISETAGDLTSVRPIAPTHAVQIGIVITQSVNEGAIFVELHRGSEILELHDVLLTNVTEGDVLVRNDSVWINTDQIPDKSYVGERYITENLLPEAGTEAPTENLGIPFGHAYMYEGGTNLVVASADVWYELTSGLTSGNAYHVTFGGSHYLAVDKPGRYKINWTASVNTSTAGQEIMGSITVNSTDHNVALASESTAAKSAANHSEIIVANRPTSLAGNTILDLDENDQVSIILLNKSAANNIVVEHITLTLSMVGGPV